MDFPARRLIACRNPVLGPAAPGARAKSRAEDLLVRHERNSFRPPHPSRSSLLHGTMGSTGARGPISGSSTGSHGKWYQ